MVTNAITDKKAAIAAIQRGQCTLQNLDHSLWKDREVVLAAVQQDGIALQYASDYLRADRGVVLAAVQQNVNALQFASKGLRAERGLVLTAVQQDGIALHFASKDLRADHEIVLAAVQQDGTALRFASKDLRANQEIVLAAVQQDGRALQFADKTSRENEQFVAELADVCPLGIVWRYKPQVTLEETAQRAMRSKDGLLLLAKQARVSLLGNPRLMKELLLSALEQGCLKETLQMLIAGQQKDILDTLRTVTAWYGVELPDALPTDTGGLNALCATLSETLVSKK